MKRPIVVIAIGYLLGIIMGLYFKISIVFLYALIIPILTIIKFIKLYLSKKRLNTSKNKKEKKFNMFYIPRYFRYLKLILNSKVLILIVIVSIISNSIIIIKNNQYDKLYKDIDKIELIGIVVDIRGNDINNTYKDIYTVKIIEVNGDSKFKDTKIFLSVNKKKNVKLNYGNKVYVEGEYKKADVARNYGGFDYKEYLKQLSVFGTVNVNYAKILEENAISKIKLNLYNLRVSIKNNAKKFLDKDVYPIFLGLILGDTSSINNETKENFKTSNMFHILAVSGMHISIIILGCSIVLNKILGKKKSKIITIFIILFYILITGFSPSIIRAGLTCVLILLAGIIHRKNDIWTSISISVLVTLIYNPYLIQNIGLQFSYIGTIGIILLNKNILKILNNKRQKKEYNSKFDKLKNQLKEIISVCISVQIFILPISIYHFNTVGIYLILTNLLLSLIITPTVIVSFVFLIVSTFNFGFLANIIGFLVNIMIRIILLISNFSFLPFSKIYIRTPKIAQIIIFYMIVIIINLIYTVKSKKSINGSELRVKNTIEVLKYKFRKNKRKNITILVLVITIIASFKFIIIKSDLNIHFVDVGQGDCCFIETPKNKTILIDGGGSETGNYDVGEKILIPYILDRGYTKIDYIIISHFDTDHIGGILTVLEELQVGEVIISNQTKDSENYKKFKEIVKQKKIHVKIVTKGDTLKIENDLYFYILWPNKEHQIQENILNNNSIVCKMQYKNFSMLFTGDIEKVAENQILEEYKENLDILKSTVLKVGHHGSKTSSIQEFIDVIKPKIALIGVGENNKFGHPNDEIIERLENLNIKIYRTDKMGEIDFIVDNKDRIRIKKHIQ